MVCLLLVTVAVVGKLGGCAIAARLVGESWKDSLDDRDIDEYTGIDGACRFEYRL